MEVKICKKCGCEKMVTSKGLFYCANCIKEYQKSDKHKDKKKEYMNEYRKSDRYKEFQKEYQKKYQKSDKCKDKKKEYRKSDNFSKKYIKKYLKSKGLTEDEINKNPDLIEVNLITIKIKRLCKSQKQELQKQSE